MILITVGTEKFSFNRLMKWIDTIIELGLVDLNQEQIIVQYGSCTVLPQGTQNYRILPENEFKILAEQARLIIAHCGEGTIDLLVTIKTPFILVPRSHSFGEHVDNHQLELAKSLEQLGLPVAYVPGDLVRFIASPTRAEVAFSPSEYYATACPLLNDLIRQSEVKRKPLYAPGRVIDALVSLFRENSWRNANS